MTYVMIKILLPLILFPIHLAFATTQEKEHRSISVKTVTSPFPGSVLFVPNDGKSHSAIVLLHGSGGGNSSNYKLDAQLLAASGFVTLAYCWWNCPSNLEKPDPFIKEVSLNKTLDAIQWLKSSKYVNGNNVGLYGYSRGAEQALLIASFTSQTDIIQAVATHATSDTVERGFSRNWLNPKCWTCADARTDCVPFSRHITEKVLKEFDFIRNKWNPTCGQSPMQVKNPFGIAAWTWNDKPIHHGHVIPVEKIKIPVFLSHGESDGLWNIVRSKRVEDRIVKAEGHVEAHYFPKEDHAFSPEGNSERLKRLILFYSKYLSNKK